jgi:hypothetical protein
MPQIIGLYKHGWRNDSHKKIFHTNKCKKTSTFTCNTMKLSGIIQTDIHHDFEKNINQNKNQHLTE